jgi:hypothetical protein
VKYWNEMLAGKMKCWRVIKNHISININTTDEITRNCHIRGGKNCAELNKEESTGFSFFFLSIKKFVQASCPPPPINDDVNDEEEGQQTPTADVVVPCG